jgi:hypothetical protein
MNLADLDIYTSAHAAVIARRSSEYLVVTGCDVHQKASPGMGVTVDAGTIKYNGTVVTVAGGDVVVTAANATYPRFDIIYLDAAGAAQISTGTAAITKPDAETVYTRFSSPKPPVSIPAGVILARVYVAANATSILNASIDDIALYGKDNYPLKTDLTAKGSLWVATAASTPANFAVGTNDLALVCDDTNASGVRWKAPVPAAHAASHKSSGGDRIGNSGTSTGTGAAQTIAHGLAAKPTMVSIVPDATGTSVSVYADATNIYPTVTNAKTYSWSVMLL